MSKTPRFLIAAPRSGIGKTTVTCAILQALVNRGIKPMAFKSGPDYIDPLFHSRVIGAKSGNLDLFFTDKETATSLLQRNAEDCDVAILEGAMGYYDGIALTDEASAFHLASATQTPVILVCDGRGVSLSICAEITGFMNYRSNSGIAGIVLNRVSPMFYPRLKAAIEAECGVPVFGYLPAMPDCTIESRHLGLVTPSDIADLKEKLKKLAQQAEKTLNLDGLLQLAESAPDVETQTVKLPEKVLNKPKIAVAMDEVFCFYYRDSLSILEELGGEIVLFSPLHDAVLPTCDGLYIGGGYPELDAKVLSENEGMRSQIKSAIESGMPTVAECGGFMYLHETLTDGSGSSYPMVGALPGNCFPTGNLGRFGYVTLTAQQDGMLCKIGEQLRGHEFHYWDSEHPGADFFAEKPGTKRCWNCAVNTKTLYAGFPHLHLYGNPEAAARFLSVAAQYQRRLTK